MADLCPCPYPHCEHDAIEVAMKVTNAMISEHLLRSVLVTPQANREEYIRSLMLSAEVRAELDKRLTAAQPKGGK